MKVLPRPGRDSGLARGEVLAHFCERVSQSDYSRMLRPQGPTFYLERSSGKRHGLGYVGTGRYGVEVESVGEAA